MDEIASNSTGEYLKLHAEIETEGAALPYRQLPEYQAFQKLWDNLVKRLKEEEIPMSSHERNIAEHWFMLGWTIGDGS